MDAQLDNRNFIVVWIEAQADEVKTLGSSGRNQRRHHRSFQLKTVVENVEV